MTPRPCAALRTPRTRAAARGKGCPKDEAGNVAQQGAEGAQRVAGTAKEEVSDLANEAGDKARNLTDELGSDLREQAAIQQENVAEGLRSLGVKPRYREPRHRLS